MPTFRKPENENYCATIVRIKNIIPLEKCDNVVATTIFGFQAIVGKATQIGDAGIVFTTETQLSDAFAATNNLYRHAERNGNPTLKGYLEDNRRVRAVKFRGHVSNALFLPLSALAFTGVNVDDLAEGDAFDQVGDIEICRKYIVPTRGNIRAMPMQPKRICRVEKIHMPEHIDTANYFRNDRNIDPEAEIYVTQKLHGTSVRIGHTIVRRKLSLRDRIAQFLGVTVQTTEHDYVFGSRKVIKDINNPNQQHYYETDIWTTEGKKLEGLVPENYLVFAELIGWTAEGCAIQADYTYNLPTGDCRLYVYRVAFLNHKGLVVDLSWDQVKEFCAQRGLRHVPELWRGKHKNFKAADWLDKKFHLEHPHAVAVDKQSIDEGVCIRVDALTPAIYKAKSPKFFEYETALLDKEIVDLESAGAETLN